MTISELKQQYVFQTLGIAAYVTEHASELKGAKGDGEEKGDKGDTGAGRDNHRRRINLFTGRNPRGIIK